MMVWIVKGLTLMNSRHLLYVMEGNTQKLWKFLIVQLFSNSYFSNQTGLLLAFLASFYFLPLSHTCIFITTPMGQIQPGWQSETKWVWIPSSSLLGFLIGPFFAILVHSLSGTITCSPPSQALQPLPGLSTHTRTRTRTSNFVRSFNTQALPSS